MRKCVGGSAALWHLVKPTIRKHESKDAVLIFNDTIEHKPYTNENMIVEWYSDHSSNVAS